MFFARLDIRLNFESPRRIALWADEKIFREHSLTFAVSVALARPARPGPAERASRTRRNKMCDVAKNFVFVRFDPENENSQMKSSARSRAGNINFAYVLNGSSTAAPNRHTHACAAPLHSRSSVCAAGARMHAAESRAGLEADQVPKTHFA